MNLKKKIADFIIPSIYLMFAFLGVFILLTATYLFKLAGFGLFILGFKGLIEMW